MEVTDRVHVVAEGWEVTRVVEPIYDLKADKIVFIKSGSLPEFEQEMIADLESTARLEVELREAEAYDLDSYLQAFSQAVKDHEDDDVYINVSTGSQIASIAGMMAAQTSDATPFYVNSSAADLDSDEVPTPEEPVFPESGEISELPVFELQGPSPEQLEILAALYDEDGLTKKELIRFAEERELPFIANTDAESDEGRYRLLESHVVDPLTNGDYVRVEKAGRQKKVYLEERGVDALSAFPLDSETARSLRDGTVDDPVEKWHWLDRETTISSQQSHRPDDGES